MSRKSSSPHSAAQARGAPNGHCMIRLERHAPDLRMHRYYTLTVEPNLFGEWSLRRAWGRIGQPPQYRIELHASELAARDAFQRWKTRKRQKGYT